MLVSKLVAILQSVPQDGEVILRDLNGVGWELCEGDVLKEEHGIVFNSQDINLLKR